MSAVLIFIHTRAELVRIHRYRPRLSVSLTVRQLAQYTVTESSTPDDLQEPWCDNSFGSKRSKVKVMMESK